MLEKFGSGGGASLVLLPHIAFAKSKGGGGGQDSGKGRQIFCRSTYAHISSTAVSIRQIKEVRKGLTRGTYPKDHCFSISYTEGKKSRTLELMAHNPADDAVLVA